ncbi:hypothetical protein RKD20_008367 [Streptomyces sp. SLBN-8D4]
MREAFRTLFREHMSDADETAAERWLAGPVLDGRYIEDVYAAG